MLRCEWAKSELDIAYHDNEWGKPLHNDKKLFELIILEGMQAGLSWSIILNKREHMREAFSDFDVKKVSEYDEKKIEELMQNANVIRNRRKLEALITNAKAFMEIQRKYGSFDKYIWSFVNNQPIINNWTEMNEIPISTDISDYMSKELKKHGFKFIGTTICYSYMQATGMVNDHMSWCEFRDSKK